MLLITYLILHNKTEQRSSAVGIVLVQETERTKEYYGINCLTSFFSDFLALEDRVERLSRNVDDKLPIYAA